VHRLVLFLFLLYTIAAGPNVRPVCGRAAGSVVSWGDRAMVAPPALDGLVAIDGGEWHTLGIRSDSTVVAWGRNEYGQSLAPSPNAGFVAVAGGGFHSLGLRADGTVVGWGSNDFGQCDVPAPGGGFVAIAAGGLHSAGLKSGGSVVAWGRNYEGTVQRARPQRGVCGRERG
jgi:alpha-tubulin suppressor-like RCC1 family protein